MRITQVKQKNEDIGLLNLRRGENSKSFEILQLILKKGVESSISYSFKRIYSNHNINIFGGF